MNLDRFRESKMVRGFDKLYLKIQRVLQLYQEVLDCLFQPERFGVLQAANPKTTTHDQSRQMQCQSGAKVGKHKHKLRTSGSAKSRALYKCPF